MKLRFYHNIAKKIGIVLCILPVFLSCVSSNTNRVYVPSHFLNPYELYSNVEYIAAVGVGDTREQSHNAALRGISEQIQVSIKSTKETFTLYNRTGLDEISAFIGTTKTHSAGIFVGVQYGESFEDATKKTHSIAYINRSSLGALYRSRMDERHKTIVALVRKSESAKGLTQFSYLLQAMQLALQNQEDKSILIGVFPSMALASLDNKYTVNSLKSTLKELGQSLVFNISVNVNGDIIKPLIQRTKDSIMLSMKNMLTSLQFSVSDTPNQNTEYSLHTTIILDKQFRKEYSTILWWITIDIKAGDKIILSKTHNGSSQGINDVAAQRFTVFEMEKIISTEFIQYIEKSFL